MISTPTAAGALARNAMPSTTGPSATEPASTGPGGAGDQGTGMAGPVSSSTGPASPAPRWPADERVVQETLPMPMPRQLPATALSLLRAARQGLAEAESEGDPATRYIGAHLAALRAAAAIVAARGEPATRRRRPRSVWELLPQVAPALAEWAAYFAASAAKRAAAEAGLPRAASAREADDLLRDASTFVAVAERALGLGGEPMLPLALRHAS